MKKPYQRFQHLFSQLLKVLLDIHVRTQTRGIAHKKVESKVTCIEIAVGNVWGCSRTKNTRVRPAVATTQSLPDRWKAMQTRRSFENLAVHNRCTESGTQRARDSQTPVPWHASESPAYHCTPKPPRSKKNKTTRTCSLPNSERRAHESSNPTNAVTGSEGYEARQEKTQDKSTPPSSIACGSACSSGALRSTFRIWLRSSERNHVLSTKHESKNTKGVRGFGERRVQNT